MQWVLNWTFLAILPQCVYMVEVHSTGSFSHSKSCFPELCWWESMRLDLFACANSDGKNSISKLTNSGQSRTASELLLPELFLLEESFLYYQQPLHRRRRKEVIFDGGASLLSLPLSLFVVIRICDELGQSLPIWSFLVPIMRRVVVVH